MTDNAGKPTPPAEPQSRIVILATPAGILTSFEEFKARPRRGWWGRILDRLRPRPGDWQVNHRWPPVQTLTQIGVSFARMEYEQAVERGAVPAGRHGRRNWWDEFGKQVARLCTL